MQSMFASLWSRYGEALGRVRGERVLILLSVLRFGIHVVAALALAVLATRAASSAPLMIFAVIAWSVLYYVLLAVSDRSIANVLFESIEGVSLREGKLAVVALARAFAFRAVSASAFMLVLSLSALPSVTLASLFGDDLAEVAALLGMLGGAVVLLGAHARLMYTRLAIFAENQSLFEAMVTSWKRTERDGDAALFATSGLAIAFIPGASAVVHLAQAERFFADTSQVLDRALPKVDSRPAPRDVVSSAPAVFAQPPPVQPVPAIAARNANAQHVTLDNNFNSLFPPAAATGELEAWSPELADRKVEEQPKPAPLSFSRHRAEAQPSSSPAPSAIEPAVKSFVDREPVKPWRPSWAAPAAPKASKIDREPISSERERARANASPSSVPMSSRSEPLRKPVAVPVASKKPTLQGSPRMTPMKGSASVPPPLPSLAKVSALPMAPPLPRISSWNDRTDPNLADDDETTLPPSRFPRHASVG